LLQAISATVEVLPKQDLRGRALSLDGPVESVTDDPDAVAGESPTFSLAVTKLNPKSSCGVRDTELLASQSVAHYLGKQYDTKLPNLGDLSNFRTSPRSLKELDKMLADAIQAVKQLWARAKHSGTSSRVALQLQIIEFITHLFCFVIPVPCHPSSATRLAASGGAAAPVPSFGEQDAMKRVFYFTDEFIEKKEERLRDPTSEKPGEDMQYDMTQAIFFLTLSYCTAWQAVDAPTRAFDSERALTSAAMLASFDALNRNQNNAKKCFLLSFLLQDDGGYHLSTALCTNHRKFEDVACSFELSRPGLLPVLNHVIAYFRWTKLAFRRELFDFRQPDKLEIRKYGDTATFTRKYLESNGYEIMARREGPMMMAPQSEMEALMTWFCDRRSKLNREHPQFGAARDMTLLFKFLCTMEMRDAQLLAKKKQLDEFATWRISFDEDAPGRQMSAGWRTNPEPPQWELLMVRGRDMDIADVTARGFGDRELLFGEGLTVQSPANVATLLAVDHPTEDDVLHHKGLPTFGDVLSDEESAVLLSGLTVPYMRIPLVLDFFASQDRHTYLFAAKLQSLLRAVLFEPGPYVSADDVAKYGERDLHLQKVPMRLNAVQKKEHFLQTLASATAGADTTALLGTPYGVLLNELCQQHPQAVLRPLLQIFSSIKELGPSSVYSANATFVLYLCEVLSQVLQFVRFARRHLQPASPSILDDFDVKYSTALETLVVPLLAKWELECQDANDTPSQCVVHSFHAMLLRCLFLAPERSFASLEEGRKETRSEKVQRAAAFLGSCAFVRVRHGFGMGMLRTQLASQAGDEALSSEDKLLRFLQAQGLDTRHVSRHQLEQGRKLMQSGGRRRAVFVQIRSRFYNDTVRVPNLIRTNAESTEDCRALKLPPVDVPEAALFGMLQEDYSSLKEFLGGLSKPELNQMLSQVVRVVLRDHQRDDDETEDHTRLSDDEDWTQTSAGVFTASPSGLVFHLHTCEVFWRHDELRPVPDSMSHFVDYETILGKDVLQCGLVQRTMHRHWVHIVGTPYDLLEWDAPNPRDQGVHMPESEMMGSPCSACGDVGRCWLCSHCKNIVCGGIPRCHHCGAPKPRSKDKKDKGPGPRHTRRLHGPASDDDGEGDKDKPEEEDNSISECTFLNVRYNRPVNIDDEAPWPVKHERWAVELVVAAFKSAYPMPEELKYKLLMPEKEVSQDANICRLLANDEIQFEDEEDRATWKEVVCVKSPPHLLIYNLVPHARRLFRSLVYSTNSHFALHSLAPLTKPRGQDVIHLLQHHAGELKKRVKNETTLEIHRLNVARGGREAFLPARLLQGVLPSALLENFLFWQGADDILRGEAPEDNPWFRYFVEVRLPLVPQATRGSSLLSRGAAAAAPALPIASGAQPAIVIRHVTSEGVTPIDFDKARQAKLGVKPKGLLARNDSSLDVGARASADISPHRRGAVEVSDANVAMLLSMFPQLSLPACRIALQHSANIVSRAADFVVDEKNQGLLERAGTDAAAAPGSPTARTATSFADLTTLEEDRLEAGVPGSKPDSPMKDSAAHDDDHDDRTVEIENKTLIFVNVTQSASLNGLAVFLTTHLEDASHILCWAELPASALAKCGAGPSATLEQQRALKAAHMFIENVSPIDIALIELPRLRLKLIPKVEVLSQGKQCLRLYLKDNPGWWMETSFFDEPSDAKPSTVTFARQLAAPFPQCAILCNAANELQLLVPNHEFHRLRVDQDPFSSLLLFDRSSLTWSETVSTPYYQYPIHASGTFVQPPTLAATLYLVVMLTARQQYSLATRYAEACYVDVDFTPEERFMFNLIDRTLDRNCPDNHPDAHAVRLKLAHAVLHSDNKPNFALHVEVAKYLSKEAHVSGACRLTVEELTDLMKRCSHGLPIIKARLELLRVAAEVIGKGTNPAAVLHPPQPQVCGQPWAKVISLSESVVQAHASKLTRMHYRTPQKPLSDAELVRFVFEDDLLTDEESGTNRQLGFYFMYLMHTLKIPVSLGGTDVTKSFAALMTKFFHLKLARWGKEAVDEGESDPRPSFSICTLACVMTHPEGHWPAVTDRMAQRLMANGVNVHGPEARETLLPAFVTALESEVRSCHRGVLLPLYRSSALDGMQRAAGRFRMFSQHLGGVSIPKWILDPEARHRSGRPRPANTGRHEVTVTIDDALGSVPRCLLSCPLGEAPRVGGFVTVPVASDISELASDSMLPFKNLSGHPEAQSLVAVDMLRRLSGDMATFRRQVRAASKPAFAPLLKVGDVDSMLREMASGKSAGADALHHGLSALLEELEALRAADDQMAAVLIARSLEIANSVHDPPGSGNVVATRKSKKNDDPMEIVLLRLRRLRNADSCATFEWLCGLSLSTTADLDLHRVNPFHGDVNELNSALIGAMLRSNRLHFVRQAIHQARAILAFLSVCQARALSQQRATKTPGSLPADSSEGMGERAVSVEALADVGSMRDRLLLLSSQLVDILTAQRHYITDSTSGDAKFDPRFLVFEFIFSILLRKRQVEMVNWFIQNVRSGQSRVQQMIMGQGKTTVVGPLLALILSDGKTLVTQVMPTALLEQSRNVLRRCFSVVIPKQIFTLTFDRSCDDSAEVVNTLQQKLDAAERHRSLVVAAPESIKALELKFVEQLHAIEDATSPNPLAATSSFFAEGSEEMAKGAAVTGTEDRLEKQIRQMRQKLLARSGMADALVPILHQWKRGVLIMDEVDVLLHPLRSELNFPIGHKVPIDCSGPRWMLPIHILDAVFAAGSRSISRCASLHELPAGPLQESGRSILSTLAAALADGFDNRVMQREPHPVLLDVAFYESRLRPILAAWTTLWLRTSLPGTTAAVAAAAMASGSPVPPQTAVDRTPDNIFSEILLGPSLGPLSEIIHSRFAPHAVQILTLARDWIQTILPHVLSKIDRVSYGLLQPEDLVNANPADLERMPLSRKLLAVPFVAKDVPSRSSEFAHPDVVVGLTILATRYEGMRLSDCRELLLQLKQDYSRQSGPRELRPASRRYNEWMTLAFSIARSRATEGTSLGSSSGALLFGTAGSTHASDAVSHTGVVPLGQLQVLDPVQLRGVWSLIRRLPDAIHYNLAQRVFPTTMNFQQLKVSACGHELGSDILFAKRIGFSGTPSNLLPLDLGDCCYEPGSDGKIVSTLTDPSVTSAEVLPNEWTPKLLLHRIATAQPSYHALIDTGALITNMDNEQVARYLVKVLPSHFEAVVFLDSKDRQMVLLRANSVIVPIGQCGVPLSRRFTFFDQIHTTGMDIRQAPTATAVVTIGKDMVFRDYAQGAYRMRGIGKGQRVHLYVIPEVATRIREALGDSHRTARAEVDVPAWLLLNAMRVEGLQFVKLCQQELANVFRKGTLQRLIRDVDAAKSSASQSDWQRVCRFTEKLAPSGATPEEKAQCAREMRFSITEFREPISYVVSDRVRPVVPFVGKVKAEVQDKTAAGGAAGVVLDALNRQRLSLVVERLVAAIGAGGRDDADEAKMGLNAEVVHEQEAEEEQEQEAEQEEQKISSFARDDEQHLPWPAGHLRQDPASLPAGQASFYPASKFTCRPQQPPLEGLPVALQLSDNFYKLRWVGLGDRRLKNCVIFLQWIATDGGTTSYAAISLAEGETLRWLIHHSPKLNGEVATCIRLLSSGSVLDATALYRTMGGKHDVDEGKALPDGAAPDEAALRSTDRLTHFVSPRGAQLFFRFFNSDMFYSEPELRFLEAEVLRFIPCRERRATFFTEVLRLRRRHRNQWDDTPVARLLTEEETATDDPDAAREVEGPSRLAGAAGVAAKSALRKIRVVVERNAAKRELIRQRLLAATRAAVLPGSSAALVADEVHISTSVATTILAPFFRPLVSTTDMSAALLLCAAAVEGMLTIPVLERHLGMDEVSLKEVEEARIKQREKEEAAKRAKPLDVAAVLAAAAAATSAASPWTCPLCTSENPGANDVCVFCTAIRPPDGAGPWPCPQCTFINEGDSRYCAVCNYDSGKKTGVQSGADWMTEVPEGYWMCSPEQGGCSKFNANSLFYCDVCDRARPDLASLRF